MKYTGRDMWIMGMGMNVMGAITGAIMHSMFLIVWNMVWLAIGIYVVSEK